MVTISVENCFINTTVEIKISVEWLLSVLKTALLTPQLKSKLILILSGEEGSINLIDCYDQSSCVNALQEKDLFFIHLSCMPLIILIIID